MGVVVAILRLIQSPAFFGFLSIVFFFNLNNSCQNWSARESKSFSNSFSVNSIGFFQQDLKAEAPVGRAAMAIIHQAHPPLVGFGAGVHIVFLVCFSIQNRKCHTEPIKDLVSLEGINVHQPQNHPFGKNGDKKILKYFCRELVDHILFFDRFECMWVETSQNIGKCTAHRNVLRAAGGKEPCGMVIHFSTRIKYIGFAHKAQENLHQRWEERCIIDNAPQYRVVKGKQNVFDRVHPLAFLFFESGPYGIVSKVDGFHILSIDQYHGSAGVVLVFVFPKRIITVVH
mmetsp:Transcript_17970/g.37046  ORF Transcript_17970/g.37046 Transcript_17970/m.37046 type:complete len:286 (-) Transcript_17970:262-1119(-)